MTTQAKAPVWDDHTCQRCGAKMIPIVRGHPTPEAEEWAARGEVLLGGCLIRGDGTDTHWYCGSCQAEE
jgi:hypothetical protein